MKIFIFIGFLILTNLNLFSQQNTNSCTDSSFRIKYSFNPGQLFITHFAADNQNSFLFCGVQDVNTASGSKRNAVFGKMSSSGNLAWIKTINSIPLLSKYRLTGFEIFNDTIFWSGADLNNNKPIIIKTDTSGNTISCFYFNINYGLGIPPLEVINIRYVSYDEIYLLAQIKSASSFPPYNLIIRITSSGTVLWSRVFTTGNGANTDAGTFTEVIKKDNNLYVLGRLQNSLQNNLAGFFTMKLNSINGQQININSFSIPALHEQNSDAYTEKHYTVSNTKNGAYLIAVINPGGGQPGLEFGKVKVAKIKLNSEYKPTSAIKIQPVTFSFNNLARDIYVNKNNETCVVFTNGNESFFSLLNNQDSLVMQAKINLPFRYSIGTDFGFSKLLHYDEAGTIFNFAQYEDNPEYKSYELYKLNGNLQKNQANCLGQDTQFVNVQNIPFTSYNFTWNGEAENIVQMQPLNMVATDFFTQPEVICLETSICDTLKLKGSTKHCLANGTATFTVFKNPQCLSKVTWQVDTTAVKIISLQNDTALHVRFLKPFHGFIKVALDGCVLKDSLYIDVNEPKQGLSLGKDTTLCPGKILILNAGNGFKTYNWQDGSNDSTFAATKPGTYFITTTDSCDNVFTDTVIVNEVNTNFNIGHPAAICQRDTAVVILPGQFTNYVWMPFGNASLHGNTLIFSPYTTTLFTVTAEVFKNCTVSDTILIKVINCPEYVYFPTAFTPNGDGTNDNFKPAVSGEIELYELIVYNRYGQLVFFTNNPFLGWDGNFSGKPQDQGGFSWYCRYKIKKRLAVAESGTVILIR